MTTKQRTKSIWSIIRGAVGNIMEVNSDGSINVKNSAVDSDSIVNLYTSTTVGSHPTILATFSVTSTSILQVESWHLETENAITRTLLEKDSLTADSFLFSNSADTRRLAGFFGINTPLEFTGPSTLTITTESGDTGKEYTVGVNSRLKDA